MIFSESEITKAQNRNQGPEIESVAEALAVPGAEAEIEGGIIRGVENNYIFL